MSFVGQSERLLSSTICAPCGEVGKMCLVDAIDIDCDSEVYEELVLWTSVFSKLLLAYLGVTFYLTIIAWRWQGLTISNKTNTQPFVLYAVRPLCQEMRGFAANMWAQHDSVAKMKHVMRNTVVHVGGASGPGDALLALQSRMALERDQDIKSE